MTLRLLLATDGSDDALAAARLLAALAPAADPTLHLLSVAAPLPALPGLPSDLVAEASAAATASAAANLEATAQALGALGDRAVRLVREGEPGTEIHAAAQELGADLVLLGARGQSAVPGFLLGSVAQDVARHAPCSVLLVRGAGAPPRRVLVAVDGSPHAVTASRFVEWFPLPRDAELQVAVVVQPYDPYGGGPAPPASAELAGALAAIRHEEWAVATHAAVEARAWLVAGGWSVDEPSITEGHPAAEILRVAGETEADLIVVGWRGARPGAGLLLGAVARKIVRYATCPVLVVKQPPRP